MKRLDTWDAFVVLFAISFGPAFVAVDLTVNQSAGPDKEYITIATIAGIIIFFLFNIVTINMLVDVFTTKTLGSYQEVAYSISRGNRGYIFLISAMKAIYLGITASFCLEFCASYMTTLIQMMLMTGDKWPPAGIWGVYVACLFFFGGILLVLFIKSADECFLMARLPSRTLFYSAWISLLSLIIILLLSINTSVQDWMAKEIRANGYDAKELPQGDLDAPTNAIEVSLGYLPTLAYNNMFTLFYLETIQQTKLAQYKKRNDANLGHYINFLIGAFYLILFVAILICQYAQ